MPGISCHEKKSYRKFLENKKRIRKVLGENTKTIYFIWAPILGPVTALVRPGKPTQASAMPNKATARRLTPCLHPIIRQAQQAQQVVKYS